MNDKMICPTLAPGASPLRFW